MSADGVQLGNHALVDGVAHGRPVKLGDEPVLKFGHANGLESPKVRVVFCTRLAGWRRLVLFLQGRGRLRRGPRGIGVLPGLMQWHCAR